MKRFFIVLFFAQILLLIGSCKKEESIANNTKQTTPTTPDGMVKIGETFIIGAKAKAFVYAKNNLTVGYNTLFVAMYDSIDGTRLTDGHFNANAMMDMGMMKHSCPSEINEEIDTVNYLYNASFVFIMPSTASNTWTLTIGFHNHKIDLEGEGELTISVENIIPTKLFSAVLTADSNAKVFVSFLLPTNPKIGINEVEFTIHKMESANLFPAIENYTLEMIPTMPAMGHSSPNNINPIHYKLGHYKGKLNLTMTGLWQIQLKLFKNGTLLSDQFYFDLTL